MSLSIDFCDISLMDLWTKVIWMLDLKVLWTLDAVNLFINRFVVEKRVYPKLMHKGGKFLKKL